MGSDRTGPSNDPLRLTVPEAAGVLGVTVDAIRGRIRRGTLDSERESGTVYVWVDRAETDRREPSATVGGQSDDQSELVEALRDQVNYLREQLEEERRVRTEERRRQDTIIAQLMQRIPEIEAPREPSGATEPPGGPSEATEQPGRVEPQPAVQSTQAQESPEMAMREVGGGPLPRDQQTPSARPWWRRVFRG